MSQFWSPFVNTLTPYVPGEQPVLPKLIKLNTNENPFGPSPRVLAAMRDVVNDDLRLYPDPDANELKKTIARYHGLSAAEVFVGNGSDEVLAIAFLALLRQSAAILFPDITYSFYPVYCRLYGIEYQTIPLDEGMRIRIDDYRRSCGGIVFPNPNAPTGIGLPAQAIEALLEQHPHVAVIVDEAYVDFGGESVLPLVRRYPNLLVVQTLSKSRSLAGLRIGFAIGSSLLIDGLERVKNSFNSYPLDRIALAGATASFEDDAYFKGTCDAVMTLRAEMIRGLEGMGFDVLPSMANFVFARHPRFRAVELAAQLREQSILVRHFDQPRINEYLRISVGSPAGCAALLRALGGLTRRHAAAP
ncbi:histidinol-phosphate transaminase [Herbaspirillum sp. HC18]|nr:histidinol-phosphate transaminase [Herbaspirillum sp. HC18]